MWSKSSRFHFLYWTKKTVCLFKNVPVSCFGFDIVFWFSVSKMFSKAEKRNKELIEIQWLPIKARFISRTPGCNTHRDDRHHNSAPFGQSVFLTTPCSEKKRLAWHAIRLLTSWDDGVPSWMEKSLKDTSESGRSWGSPGSLTGSLQSLGWKQL